jgi:hypothetical protein
MALCLLLKCLCGCSTFGVGSGVCLKVARPLVSRCHCVCHLSLTTLRDHSFNLDFKECSTGGSISRHAGCLTKQPGDSASWDHSAILAIPFPVCESAVRGASAFPPLRRQINLLSRINLPRILCLSDKETAALHLKNGSTLSGSIV